MFCNARQADDDGFTDVLLETNQGGEFLSEKACETCAAGTYVFATESTEAGVYYAADPLTCQSCPDEHMSFDATGQCSCNTGCALQSTAVVVLVHFFLRGVKTHLI